MKYSIHDTDSNTSYIDLNLFDCHWTYPHDAQQLRRGAPRRRAPTPMPARLVPFWRPKRGGEKMEKRSRGGGLDLEKAGDTLRIVGCCTQAVNSIGGHCHKHAGLQSTHGFMYQVPTRWVW